MSDAAPADESANAPLPVSGLMAGKKGVVFGIANERSIAWGITQQLAAAGAKIGFTHFPDSDPKRAKNEKKVRKLVDPLDPAFVMPCNVGEDAQIDAVYEKAAQEFGKLDFVLHSVASAKPDDLKGPVYNVSRDGFAFAMDVSVYSLIALANRAKPLMNEGGSILCLTYLGGEKVIPGYNLMGLCKSALESATQYLAYELGRESKVRVNALSAGPMRTISSSGVGDFKKMLALYEMCSPMQTNIDENDVGKAGLYLLSDLSSGVSGEVHHVDMGYHCVGAPPVDAFDRDAG